MWSARLSSSTRSWLLEHRAGLVISIGLAGFGLLLWSISPAPDIRPPSPADRAFASLMALRRAALALAAHSGWILGAIGALALAVIWGLALRCRRIRQARSTSVIVLCILAALQAQTLVMRGELEGGGALYLLALGAFCGLSPAWIDRRTAAQAIPLSRRAEWIALTLVLAVTVFGRFYDLKRMPYGIDGDESKWTIEVVSVVVDGRDDLSSEYHRRYLPMSFWMETPFQWLLGPGLTPGRIEVAFFSAIASFFFYRLARELFDAPTALVATLLLAVSLPDITASRAGNVESHVKLWTILPFYGLSVALRTRQARHFLLAGFAAAGAMLTYETLMPALAAVVTLALASALREWRDWRAWLRRLALLATAPAVVAFVTIDYLLGRMQYYQGYRQDAEALGTLGDQLLTGAQGLIKPFVQAPNVDALFHRFGPYINGLLVPLLALGIVYAAAHARRKGAAFALAWLAWVFIPIPLILHTPLPRIFYPGAPVLYLLVALALVQLYRAIVSAIGLPRLAAALGTAGLAAFCVLNLTIWFQESEDSEDELRRREVAELVVANLDPAGPILAPYFPFGETVEIERGLIDLLARERRGARSADGYQITPFDELLPRLAGSGAPYTRLKVLYDTTQLAEVEARRRILETFQRCYPNVQRIRTEFFEMFTVAGADLAEPACRSAALNVTPDQAQSENGAPSGFDWSIEPASPVTSTLQCWRERDTILWLEAESLGQREGWIADARFVTGWSGTGYLADNMGSQFAGATISIPQPGVYRVWVRTLRRQADDFPAFIRLGREPPMPFGETGLGELNAWRWQAVADLPLEAGRLPIQLTRPFQGSILQFIALFVDTVVLSPDLSFDPARDERWQFAFTQETPALAASGRFEAPFEPGRYRCEITVSDGGRLVDGTGHPGITSDPMEFEVRR